MHILLANPRGFCAGVERAIAIVERAIEKFGAPIYVRHEVVHNKFVCDDLRAKGAIFIDELAEVPTGATVIFSAHGVSPAVRDEAEARGLKVFDATCPLVTKVHLEVARQRKEGREIVMIGHKGHPEVEGTMGQSPDGMLLVESAADVATLKVRDRNNSPTSPRPRSRSTTRKPSSARCAAASRTSSDRRKTTSATPRRTARTPSSNSRHNATCYSSSAQRTAPTPTACVKSPPTPASRPTSSTAPKTSTQLGSPVTNASVSPPGRRHRRFWLKG